MTNGIKVPVSADLQGLNQAMDDFRQKARMVFGDLNGSAKIDTASAQKGLQALQQSVQALHSELTQVASSDISGKSIEGLSAGFEEAVKNAKTLESVMAGIGGKGSAGFQKTVAATRQLIAGLEKARRLQAALVKEGRQMTLEQAAELEKDFQFHLQQGGKSVQKRFRKFGDLATVMNNWRDLAGNEISSRRQYRELLQSLGISQNAPSPGQPSKSFAQIAGADIKRATLGVFRTLTPSGAGGSIMGQAAEEAAATPGGLMSGMGMQRLLAGGAIGLAAYGGIRAISAIHGKMRSSEEEGIGYADLSRQMGFTTASFDELRDAVRDAAQGLDMAFGAGSKLAEQYIQGAGIDGLRAQDLNGELRSAGGFARMLGMDPEAGAGLFATLRHNKVSSGDAQNKRIAMMIGEGIARAGVFTKADDVLAAVAGYTQQATHASFNAANVEGFMGGMGSFMSLGMAGLDPNASAALLSKADAGIRNPNSEAARNFLLGIMQNRMGGFNAVDLGVMLDGGAFGSAGKQFGEGSSAMRAAKANGDTALVERYRRMAAQGGSTTTIDTVLDAMAGKDTDALRENLKGMFGFNGAEANAMITAYRNNGGISEAVSNLSKYGIDPARLGPTSLKHLIDIEYGDEGNLAKKSKFLRTQNLSAQETAMLDAAERHPGEGNADLKAALIKLASSRDMEMTEGDVSRKNMAALDNIASDLATKLIPISNAIREGIAAIASAIPGSHFKDRFGLSDQSQHILDARLKAASNDPEARRQVIGSFQSFVENNSDNFTPEYQTKLGKMYDEAAAVRPPPAGQGGSLPSGHQVHTPKRLQEMAAQMNTPIRYDESFKQAAARYGVDWMDLKQIGVQESGLRPGARNLNKNGTEDRGIMQLNSRYDAERGVTDPVDPEQNIMVGAKVWAQALKQAKGDVRQAFRIYNGSGPRAEQYADNAMRLRRYARPDAAATYGMMPLPAGAQSGGAGTANVKVSGEFTLRDPHTGRQAAAPVHVAGITAPVAAGVR